MNRGTKPRRMANTRQRIQSQSGLTLVELILVMGIVATLYGISTISLSRLIPKTAVTTSTETLRSELRLLQAKAMQGDIGLVGGPSEFGVRFAGDSYTFFEGTTYSASSSSNVVTEFEQAVTVSSTLPNQTIVFQRGSGEVLGYIDGQNSVTLTNSDSGETSSFRFNRYGVMLDE